MCLLYIKIRALVALVSITSLFLAAPTSAWATSTIPIGPGINVNGLFYGPNVNVEYAALFSKLRSSGFQWIRLPIKVDPVMAGDTGYELDIKKRLSRAL